MPRQDQSSYQMVLVVMCVGVLSALASLGDTADTASLTTRPEDPLQPVWNSLDAIPAQVLAGFKGQIEILSRSSEASLLTVRTHLSTLEANLKKKIETLGEDTGDLVTDRLVNAEALILEDINKLAATLTSLTQKCDLCAVAVQSHQETQESTRCSDEAASAMARMEATVARVEAAAIKMDRTAERVDETAVKVDEVARKVDEIATRMEEVEARINDGKARVEAVAARVEEVEARISDGTAKVEEVAARVEEVAARVEKATLYVEEAASKAQQSAIGITGVTTPTNTTSPRYYPLDCADIHWRQPDAPSKVYLTYPTLEPQAPVSAFCDMGLSEAKETGGWTVVLRRQNTSWGLENFNRSWAEYTTGFGQPGKGEWWYGLAPLHALTFRQQYEAVFLLHDIEQGTFIATYTTFRLHMVHRWPSGQCVYVVIQRTRLPPQDAESFQPLTSGGGLPTCCPADLQSTLTSASLIKRGTTSTPHILIT
ncbi:fibrinogen C domain-containing protein 1-like isoform X2 [Eriocheir sinensis]|uniref:fibrinogen C domain-containing protein 1-like isoform X2 n=1 Tax=Eriocheir sinensis TaxID=95602 RepID=UPI0021C89DC3|nr:fibrinogen C domain-containing protein 1-like isoform X2 [Eriocheir sinensis]